MTAAPPAPRSPLLAATTLVLAAAVVAAGVVLWRQGLQLESLGHQQAKSTETLQQVLGEVTRMRLEQSAGSKGPQALLEKLRTYAPLVANSRTTEPDFRNAQKELDAVMMAFSTIGQDAWKPIQSRLSQLLPEKDFDEIKQLLRASTVVDKAAGTQQLKEILLGRKLPSPRLRWFAAQHLSETDLPMARTLLRQVLLTESHRGFNAGHAQAFPDAAVPDRAAIANTGFFNFVTAYVRTADPEMESTLLMVLGRVEHDVVTIQECVKALGEKKSAAAVPVIEKLYTSPPLQQENPVFLNHCLTALADIQGRSARPFLEQALTKASSDVVQKHIQFLLNKIG